MFLFSIFLIRRSQSLRATSYGSSDRLHSSDASKQRRLGKLIAKLDSNDSNFDAERKGGKQTNKQIKTEAKEKLFHFFQIIRSNMMSIRIRSSLWRTDVDCIIFHFQIEKLWIKMTWWCICVVGPKYKLALSDFESTVIPRHLFKMSKKKFSVRKRTKENTNLTKVEISPKIGDTDVIVSSRIWLK